VATDRRWTDSNGQRQQQTTWHNIVAWGRTAEVMKEYLSKGREVFIEGRIENRTYDKKDGTKGYASEVIVESFSFVGSRGDSGDSSPAPTDAAYSQESPPAQGGSGGSGGDDDDLPF
jgi:single-strand DNA-binding protein